MKPYYGWCSACGGLIHTSQHQCRSVEIMVREDGAAATLASADQARTGNLIEPCSRPIIPGAEAELYNPNLEGLRHRESLRANSTHDLDTVGSGRGLLPTFLLSLFMAVFLTGCVFPPKPPTPPSPIPPVPSPTPTPVPAGEIQIVNGKASSPIFGAVGCCNTPPRDAARGWTLAGPEELDAYQSIGGNMAVFRTGPYSDQGYGWSLIVNPVGESRLRAGCKYANAHGQTCLVEAGADYWSLKPQNSVYNLYHDSCAVTHGAPPLRYQRWVRAIVKEVGDLNVWWSLGNEGWLCAPTKDWYDGLVFQIRQAETDFGYRHHPVGNVWPTNGVGLPRYDFAEVHGNPDITQSDIGIPVVLTESDNENPPESNERWLVAKERAKATYGAFNILIWRGAKEDPDWDALFASLGGHSPARGIRVDSSCVWNKDSHTWAPACKKVDAGCVMTDAEAAQQATAVEKVIAYAPWLFTNGGNNLVYTRTTDDDYTLRDFFSLNQAMLQPACSIAGNPEAANSFDEVDNIEVWPVVDPCVQSATTAGVHEIVFGPEDNHFQVMRGTGPIRQQFQGRTTWFTDPANPCGTVIPTPGPVPDPGPSPVPPGPPPVPRIQRRYR
jgi:hypothetical protein